MIGIRFDLALLVEEIDFQQNVSDEVQFPSHRSMSPGMENRQFRDFYRFGHLSHKRPSEKRTAETSRAFFSTIVNCKGQPHYIRSKDTFHQPAHLLEVVWGDQGLPTNWDLSDFKTLQLIGIKSQHGLIIVNNRHTKWDYRKKRLDCDIKNSNCF
jgi:hypothetical protein